MVASEDALAPALPPGSLQGTLVFQSLEEGTFSWDVWAEAYGIGGPDYSLTNLASGTAVASQLDFRTFDIEVGTDDGDLSLECTLVANDLDCVSTKEVSVPGAPLAVEVEDMELDWVRGT